MNRQFKVAFYLRTGYKAKDGKVPVIARIYLNNERMTLGSAGVNVDPAQWDSKAGRVKTLTIRARKLGLLEKDPFADFKIRFKKVDRGFLTDEEIDTIMQKEINTSTATLSLI